MADRARRRPQNADGWLLVDESCIDGDTCRWMAPGTSDRAGGRSRGRVIAWAAVACAAAWMREVA